MQHYNSNMKKKKCEWRFKDAKQEHIQYLKAIIMDNRHKRDWTIMQKTIAVNGKLQYKFPSPSPFPPYLSSA